MKHSVRKSLAISLLTLAIVPLLLAGIVLVWHNYRLQAEQTIQYQEEISKRAVQSFIAPIIEIQNDLLSIANIYDIVHQPYTIQKGLLERLRISTDKSHYNIVTELVLLNKDGKELVKTSKSEIYTIDDLKDRSKDPCFIQPNINRKAYFSNLWFDATTGDPRLTMSVPWENTMTNEIDAVLVAELRLKEIWRMVTNMKVGKSGNIYIADDQGRVIAHSSPSIVLRGTQLEIKKASGFSRGVENEYALMVYTPTKLGERNFYIVSEVPPLEALNITITMILTILSVMGFALIASVYTGYNIVQRMVIPVESLADVAGAITAGDLQQKAHIERDDELGFLASTFNKMTSQLLENISDLESHIAHIDHMAHHDHLTDLPNKRHLEKYISMDISQAQRHGYYGALLFIDLDNFKKINDSLGHSCGDALLKEVAARLSDKVRIGDLVARLGGDEFVVVLRYLSNRDSLSSAQLAKMIADKIRIILSAPYDIQNMQYHITASIGIAMFPLEKDTPEDIIKHADTAMYHSKAAGKNTIYFYNPHMQKAADERLNLEKDLHHAIQNHELTLYYQPIYNQQNIMVGVESLIRWIHPEKGLISPAKFIPLAEESGLILTIGEWVLYEACEQFNHWKSLLPDNSLEHIAVNVSYRQFRQNEFAGKVLNAIKQTQMPANALKIEITESIAMTDIGDTIYKMEALKNAGIQFSIDDFGTGYSSLSYLSQLPLDVIKIDQSFIRQLPEEKHSEAIVETIISMANHLNLKVVAEGIETVEQASFLQNKGCDYYQGYYFSRPVTADQISQLLIGESNSPKPLKYQRMQTY